MAGSIPMVHVNRGWKYTKLWYLVTQQILLKLWVQFWFCSIQWIAQQQV